MDASPLRPHTFLHRANTPEVKIRPVIQKNHDVYFIE